MDGKFARRLAFEHLSGDDNVFKNGSIGNVTDEKGVIVGPKGFTFDRVRFHDVRVTDQAIHNECVYATGAEGLTITNSTFHACATMDLFFTNFEGGPQYGNVTLESNVFEHTTMEDPDSWHFYSMYVHQIVNGMRNWVVRYNTFETGVSNVFEPGTPPSSGRWVGNVGDWECVPGITYRYNVGMACGDLDSGVFPAASTRTREAALRLGQRQGVRLPSQAQLSGARYRRSARTSPPRTGTATRATSAGPQTRAPTSPDRTPSRTTRIRGVRG